MPCIQYSVQPFQQVPVLSLTIKLHFPHNKATFWIASSSFYLSFAASIALDESGFNL